MKTANTPESRDALCDLLDGLDNLQPRVVRVFLCFSPPHWSIS